MAYQNYKQVIAIKKKNEIKIKKLFPNLTNESGIYIMTRVDENGFKFAYIGQAVKILDRILSHMTGYQHIDLSMKKHGLYSNENIYGWDIKQFTCNQNDLDLFEQKYIKRYADLGYQLRNKTTGSQGAGKQQLDEYKPHKGYRDGVKQGEKNARVFVANLFEKHLNFSKKSDTPNKNQDKAFEKFEEFLKGE